MNHLQLTKERRRSDAGYILVWGMSSILGIAALGGLLLHNFYGNQLSSEALLQARIFAAAGYHNALAPDGAALNLMALTARLNGFTEAVPQQTNVNLGQHNATLSFAPAADARRVTASVSFHDGLLKGWLGYTSHSVVQQATAEIPNSNAVVNIDMSASLNVSSRASTLLSRFGMAEPMATPPPNALAVRLPFLFGMGPPPRRGEPGPAWTRHWAVAPDRHTSTLPACTWESVGAAMEAGEQTCDGGDVSQQHAISIFTSDLFQVHYKDSVNTLLATIAFSFRDIFVNTFSGPLTELGREALRDYGVESVKRLGLPEPTIDIPSGDESAVFTLWDPLDPENTSHNYVFSQLPKNNLLYNLQGCFGLSSYLSLLKYAEIETSENGGKTWQEPYAPGAFAWAFAPIRHPLTPNNLGNAFPSERWDSDPYSADLGYFPLCVTPIVGGGRVYPQKGEMPDNIRQIERDDLDAQRQLTGSSTPIAQVQFPDDEAPEGAPYIWDGIQALTIGGGSGTYTPAALQRARQQFARLATNVSDSHTRQNIVILVTDGIPADPANQQHLQMLDDLKAELDNLKSEHGATIVTLLLKQPSLRTVWRENVRRAIEAVWGSLAATPDTVPSNIRALWNEHIEPMTPIVSTSAACTTYAQNAECCSGGPGGTAGGFCHFWNEMLIESTRDDDVANAFKGLLSTSKDMFIEIPLDETNFAPEKFLLPSMAALAQLVTPGPEFSH